VWQRENIAENRSPVLEPTVNSECVLATHSVVCRQWTANRCGFVGSVMKLTTRSRVLEEVTVTQLVKNFPSPLWNPTVHYRVHNSPSMVLILRQMNPVHLFLPYLPKNHFNNTLPSTPLSSEWSLPSSFRQKLFTHFSFLPYVLHVPPISFFLTCSP